MNEALVSIIIPCYNHSGYVKDTLNSVLQEDYPNKEIVIIDDGSTDNSVEMIQQWVDLNSNKIPVTFISRPNKGLIRTLNELLDNAKGEFLVLIASDDMLCNNGISKRITLLQETNKMVAVGDCTVIDGNNNVTYKSWMKDVMKKEPRLYSNDESIMREVLVSPAISGAVLLINKKVFDKIGRYPEDLQAEDWYFYQRCAAEKYIVYIDEIVSLYRRHDTNISGPNTVLKRKEAILSIVKTYRYNWKRFPGIKFKFIALREYLRWEVRYLRNFTFRKAIDFIKFR